MGWVDVLLVSAMPFSELRGGIPLAIYYGLDPLKAYLLAVAGNFLPVPFLLLTLGLIERLALKTPFAGLYMRIVERIERKKGIVEKYGYPGLIAFVAIPLPFTGAWSGTLLAFILRLNRAKALVCILLGIIVAGFVVLSASLGVLRVLS